MQEINFRSQARIVRTLGDRLISGEVAAIIELVKNSYDADATSCFIEINPQKDSITVRDDGHGMSLQDVESKWAEIGTDNKKQKNRSRSGKRHVLGDKGIGRLAASKLGRRLEILSTTQQDSQLKSIQVSGIDWDKFSAEKSSRIEDIKFYVEEIEPANKSGTTIAISSLSQVWSKKKLETLVLELRKLMSPIAKKDSDFNVYLNLDAFEKKPDDSKGFDGSEIVNGPQTLDSKNDASRNAIKPLPVLDACDYTFNAEYTKNTLKGTFKINDAEIEHAISVALEEDIDLGKGLVQFNIFDRDVDSLENTFSKIGTKEFFGKQKFSVREARRHIDDISGIAIYRNEFRVRPYGDSDADWLSLAKRRVQNPSLRLEQAQIAGLILVDTADSSGLIEKSSREGFEDNDHYAAFKRLIIEALKQIEQLRFVHNEKTGKNRAPFGSKAKLSNLSAQVKTSLEKIASFSDSDGFSGKEKEDFKESFNEHRTRLDKLIKIMQERQAILEARSTLGLIFAEVVHEARHPTSAVGSNLIYLSKAVEKKWGKDITPAVSKDLLKEFKRDIGHIEDLEALFKRLDPLIRVRNKKPKNFLIYEIVKKSILIHQERVTRLGVKVLNDKPSEDLIMRGVESDLSAAIINLIDNSLYWHQKRNTSDPFIKISYENKSDSICLKVEDNAGGILEKWRDSIFNVGFTTKGEGSGLGLNIAKESLDRSGASIELSDTSSDGTVFTIEITKEI